MKKRILIVFGLCLLVVALTACQAKPEEIALQLADAVNAKDLESALALFTEDAVVTSASPEPFVGKEGIQIWLEGMFADNFHLEAEIVEVNEDVIIERDVITMDSLTALGISQLEGESEIALQDGKIKTINFTFTDESLVKLQAAMEAAAAQIETAETQSEPAEAEEPAEKPEPTPTPGPKPAPRGVPRMAYDSESVRVILFGGYIPPSGRAYNDTWAYDPIENAWSTMKPDPSPGKSDGPMSFDIGSDRIILFIGAVTESGDHSDFEAGGETWAYDYNTNTWMNLEPEESPSNLKGAQMVYDVESDRMILFGGWAATLSGNGFNDTWAFDYDTNTWTKMEPEVSPPSRYYHAMAYDTESDRVILWGGYGPKPIDVSVVWAYNYNENVWDELDSASAPEPAGYGAMVYDAASDLTILYAGKGIWTFDYNTNTWTQVSEMPEPGKLFYHGMVCINEIGRVIAFGGGPTMGIHFNKTWSYDPNSNIWTNLTE